MADETGVTETRAERAEHSLAESDGGSKYTLSEIRDAFRAVREANPPPPVADGIEGVIEAEARRRFPHWEWATQNAEYEVFIEAARWGLSIATKPQDAPSKPPPSQAQPGSGRAASSSPVRSGSASSSSETEVQP